MDAALVPFLQFLDESSDDSDSDDFPVLLVAATYKRKRTIPKLSNFVENVVVQYSENQFQRDFRISKKTFEVLINEISPALRYLPRSCGREPIEHEKQLLIYLWYISNQDSMREMERMFGVSQFSVHKIVRRVSRVICNCLKSRVIKWPNVNTQEETSRRIADRSGVENCVGFIDGTHIRLSCIPGGDKDYINRKGFPSIQLQLVVDDTLTITDTYVGWPGCTHDARVFRNSPLQREMSRDRVVANNKFIIGDAAYPLAHNLMTPFRDTGRLTPEQRIYNTKISSIRQTVERAIGHLKCRFRRLRDIYCRSIENCCYLITSACILHNLCIINDDHVEDYIHVDNAQQDQVNCCGFLFQRNIGGVNRRNRLVQDLSRYMR